MFFLYKWMLQVFGWVTWGRDEAEPIRLAISGFKSLFQNVGVNVAAFVLIILTLMLACYYYFGWTKHSSSRVSFRYRRKWWLLWLIATSIVIALATYGIMYGFMSFSMSNLSMVSGQSKMYLAVSFCNFIYALVLFFGLSILFSKAFSKYTNASCTPF
ncbi:hypothetical protein [Alistipes sp.]|uniref:hypothetical protein n=1 Tax=Alistipes sp. TaxID=1872444 RepID=UPI0025BCE186|nr:hypothetical protein [Alistipes sp.]